MAWTTNSGGVAAPRRRRPRKPRNGANPGGSGGTSFDSRNPNSSGSLSFGDKKTVKGGVKKRALKRSKAVGKVKGVNTKDGITGREARKIKRAWIREGRPKPGDAGGGNANGRNRPPKDPYAKDINAMTRTQFGGQERQLESERRISGQQTTNLNDWYGQYQAEVKAAEERTRQGYAGAQASLAQQAQTATTQDMAFQGQVAGQQAQQTAITGATPDPALAQQAQQAAGARQALSNSFGGMIVTQGASQNAFMANQQGVIGGQRIQALTNEQARARKIEELSRELLADKGAFKVQARTQLKDAEHKAALENQAFGLDVLEEQNDVANENRDDRRDRRSDRADNRNDRRTRRETRRHNQQTEAQARREEARLRANANDGGSSGGSGDSPKFTQSQRNAAQRAFRDARRLASRIGAGKGERGDAIDFIADKHDIDSLIARAAVAPWTLSDKQRRELKRMGIKVRKPPSTGGPSTGGGQWAPGGP